MKKIFRKILMSVICVMLVMPVYAQYVVVCPITLQGGKWVDLTNNVSFSVSGDASKTYVTKHKSGRCFNVDISCDKFNQNKVSISVTAKGYAPVTLRGDGKSCSYNAKMEKGKQLTISGTVVNEKTGKPVANAEIRITTKDGTKSYKKATCKTDSKGVFNATFDDIPNGAKMKVYHEDYQEQELEAGSNIQVKLKPRKPVVLNTVIVEDCGKEGLTKKHAKEGKLVKKDDGNSYCVPTVCMDGYELKGEICEQIPVTDPNGGTSGTPGTPGVSGTTDPNGGTSGTPGTPTVPGTTDPNGGTSGTPTVPGTTDPNIAVTPIVVNPVVVTPAPKVATCQTPIKVDAVRSALGNAPADMDKQKFMDTLSACNVVTVCEILEACVKSVPAGVACKECEQFIRDIVGYHNR